MANYQRKTLADMSNIGVAAMLPSDLEGLADETLADLSASIDPDACEALGYSGQGFFPVADPQPPPVIPTIVAKWRAKIALHNAGLLTAVETAIASADVPTQILWSDVPEFHRDSPELAAVIAGLGMTSDQVDDLFIAAAAIG